MPKVNILSRHGGATARKLLLEQKYPWEHLISCSLPIGPSIRTHPLQFLEISKRMPYSLTSLPPYPAPISMVQLVLQLLFQDEKQGCLFIM